MLLPGLAQQLQQLHHQRVVGGNVAMALQDFGRRFGDGVVLAHQLGIGRAEGGAGSGRTSAIEASGIKAGDQQQAGGVGVEAEQGEIGTCRRG